MMLSGAPSVAIFFTLANRLARLPLDVQLFEMMNHIRKTMPAGESLFCNDERLEQLAVRQL